MGKMSAARPGGTGSAQRCRQDRRRRLRSWVSENPRSQRGEAVGQVVEGAFPPRLYKQTARRNCSLHYLELSLPLGEGRETTAFSCDDARLD